ncbi:MAG: hypothetical protein JXA93_01680 [Anaerolineae bacterium]|nr:hypothetical protein [Anaerolineae bacterium]
MRQQRLALLVSWGLLGVACLAALAILGWQAVPVYAAVIVVDESGTNSSTCGTELNPCETIPYAVTQRAGPGDTVFVRPGTYPEQVTLRAGIIISGAGTTRTFIDGGGTSGPMVQSTSGTVGPSTVVRGVTIRGGLATYGGGVYLSGGASPLIDDCVISENRATSRGGGIYVTSGSLLTLSGTVVISNTSYQRGGGMYYSGTELHVLNSRFENNSSDTENGGGLWVSGLGILTNTVVISNTADNWGGGIFQSGNFDGRGIQMFGGRVERNTAKDYNGGGIWADRAVALYATQVLSNTANERGGGVGGLHVRLTDAIVRNNSTPDRGGGIHADSTAVLTATEVISNSANRGGGLYSLSSVEIENSLFVGNDATAGGAVYMEGATAVDNHLCHLTIVGPADSTNQTTAGILSRGDTVAYITNTIVTSYPYAIEAYDGGTIEEDYNLYYALDIKPFHDNGGTLITSTRSLTDVDPIFVDPAQGDYHIAASSPALDAGDFVGVTTDLDGDPRPTNTAQPDAPDIGCDENRNLTVQRPISTTITFGAACASLVFTDTGSLSDVTVTVVYTYPTGQEASKPLPRYYEISANGSGPFEARLLVCYTDEEFDASDVTSEAGLRLYRWAGDSWTALSGTVDTANNVVTAGGVDTFSRWAIGGPGGEPTAVELTAFEAVAVGGQVTVKWETASEIDLLGFHLFRSSERTGELIRLNQEIIPGAMPGSPQGAQYEFTDRAIESGATYFYWLESVDLHGQSAQHGPVSVSISGYRCYLPLLRR